jgi:hypothetical protein
MLWSPTIQGADRCGNSRSAILWAQLSASSGQSGNCNNPSILFIFPANTVEPVTGSLVRAGTATLPIEHPKAGTRSVTVPIAAGCPTRVMRDGVEMREVLAAATAIVMIMSGAPAASADAGEGATGNRQTQPRESWMGSGGTQDTDAGTRRSEKQDNAVESRDQARREGRTTADDEAATTHDDAGDERVRKPE